ncbi:Gamma-interferon-inducible lysosomal thiol reductase [Strongyloides ratti]|uniref:Gamma-interferon-inducible lysosomal thiol reductase n=1 Tax=Strongyloides ratti TaxID=34506 RepID=A0A090N011_STRRB|nr:Gamma-interferon-inducible lysosomal thiol reductase [Strongyloides ratti]CEF69875.1 Gamma-interferon-inducible lysosomal thiol reductase [Strongyloides ratti]
MKIFLFIIFLFFNFFVTDSYNSLDCAEIPPALWCKNDKVKKECGFDKLCNRYERRMTNQTLKITLLYEALCPDCQEFILGPLHDVYTHFENYIDLELVPFGNAKYDEKTKKITCQHGEEECKVNKYEGCAINFLPKPFHFIFCLESKLEKGYDLKKAAPTCLEYVKADVHAIDLITHCFNGEQGNKFQLAYFKRTLEAYPDEHEHVPWLYFNDISLHSAQIYQSILPQTICQWLVTDNLPDVCYKENINEDDSIEISDEINDNEEYEEETKKSTDTSEEDSKDEYRTSTEEDEY